MNAHQFETVFPYGSHLCREPMPAMSELKHDMETLQQAGFNLVKLQEHWAIDEPAEGRLDFSRYEELIEHAAALDMGVYVDLTCEQAPNWLWEKHPDCRMIGRDGLPVAHQAQTTLPADGKPGPCYDHPGAHADQLRFIRRLVETLGRFENVVVWNTWQEIAYWSEGLVGQHVCYCPHTLAHFRRWLAEKYGDLDNLNRAWNTRYADWDAVLPERLTRKPLCAQEIQWRLFMDNAQIGRVLRDRARVIRETDPQHRPVFAHKGSPVIGSGQDWTYARCQDFLGTSCYPAWGSLHGWDDGGQPPFEWHTALLTEMWHNVALKYDYIRSCNPKDTPVWAAEFQGGPVSTGFHKGRIPTPDDIRRWILTTVGCGTTAVSFWVTRAEIMAAEVNGFSLLDSAGDSTPRFEEAARVGRALNRYPDLFARPTRPCADVAILINEQNWQFCSAMAQGGEHLGYSVRGWYRLLWNAGIPVDFVEIEQNTEEELARYRALILPFPMALSEPHAEKLIGYVESGGNLISEACPGRCNENAYANRGELSPTMARLFGVRHNSFTMVREPDDGRRWSPAERTWGEYLDPIMLNGTGSLAGHELRCHVYLETFAADDAAVCLRHDDACAGVVRPAGNGSAWLLGTFVGHCATAYRDTASRDCVRSILRQCGIRPVHEGRLLLQRRSLPEQEAWIFTNPHDNPVSETIDLGAWQHAHDLLADELLTGKDGAVVLEVEPLDVRCLIVSGWTQVIGAQDPSTDHHWNDNPPHSS